MHIDGLNTMNDFTFTDRLSWISWRANWRAQYATASNHVRASKRQLAELHSTRRLGGSKAELLHIDAATSSLQSELAHDRRTAHALMTERTKADECRVAQIADRRQMAA
jgi:hypothetical protein